MAHFHRNVCFSWDGSADEAIEELLRREKKSQFRSRTASREECTGRAFGGAVSAVGWTSKSRAARPIRNCLASNRSSVLDPPSLLPITTGGESSVESVNAPTPTPCNGRRTTCATRCERREVVEAQLLVDALFYHESFEIIAINAAIAVLENAMRCFAPDASELAHVPCCARTRACVLQIARAYVLQIARAYVLQMAHPSTHLRRRRRRQ